MQSSIILLLLFSFIAANLPWISEKFFLVYSPATGAEKKEWMRLVEWLGYAMLSVLLAWGLEKKEMGVTHPQDWEFYAIFISLFAVFAFPSFLYRHLIRHILNRKSL